VADSFSTTNIVAAAVVAIAVKSIWQSPVNVTTGLLLIRFVCNVQVPEVTVPLFALPDWSAQAVMFVPSGGSGAWAGSDAVRLVAQFQIADRRMSLCPRCRRKQENREKKFSHFDLSLVRFAVTQVQPDYGEDRQSPVQKHLQHCVHRRSEIVERIHKTKTIIHTIDVQH